MTNRINIKKEVIEWAIKKSNKDFNIIQDRFPAIEKWIAGDKDPTFKQVQELSNFLNMPFGYLIVDTPPKEEIELLKFRTVDSEESDNPSRELIDTINEMTIKQSWMKNYLIEAGYDKNHIINQLNINDSVEQSAEKIRKLIELPENWYISNKNNPLKYLRDKFSYNGILMMQSGIAKNNTHRPLNVMEFRAFCLIDDYAPLIFINTKDSEKGKVFSMMHEIAHIALGIENIFNDNSRINNEYRKIESVCNKIAAELLVPNNTFIDEWENHKLNSAKDKIYDLSSKFVASKIVISRKALDNKYIAKSVYEEIVSETFKLLNTYEQNKKTGGNAINNAKSRLDTNFTIAISDGLKNGRALHSDIYKLTGLKPKMFNKIVESMGINNG